MKPTLNLKPNEYAYQNLLMKFADGIPLSADQLNFLDRHQRILSNSHLDPVMKYYLKHYRHDHAEEHSFLMSGNDLNHDEIVKLKRRLSILLKERNHIEFKMKPSDFLQFRALTTQELILYHGNQLLTGAPFYQGGIPQLIFFQWGNLFGVGKYVVLAEEKALKSNVLIYFEELHERRLQECVYQYVQRLQDELKQQLAHTPTLQPRPTPENQPAPRSLFQTPTLTLSPLKQIKEEE